MLSDAPLLTTAKTVRQSMSPEELALKRPASVNAPVPSPAANVATYAMSAPDTVVEVSALRSASDPRAESPAAAAVDPVPTAM